MNKQNSTLKKAMIAALDPSLEVKINGVVYNK